MRFWFKNCYFIHIKRTKYTYTAGMRTVRYNSCRCGEDRSISAAADANPDVVDREWKYRNDDTPPKTPDKLLLEKRVRKVKKWWERQKLENIMSVKRRRNSFIAQVKQTRDGWVLDYSPESEGCYNIVDSERRR